MGRRRDKDGRKVAEKKYKQLPIPPAAVPPAASIVVCWRCRARKLVASGLLETCQDCYDELEAAGKSRAFRDGRSTKCTPENIEKLVRIVAGGAHREPAAAFIGVDRATLFRWLKKGAEGLEPYVSFRNAMAAAESQAELTMTKVLVESGKKDPQWALKFLERRFAERWAQRNGDVPPLEPEAPVQVVVNLTSAGGDEPYEPQPKRPGDYDE